MAIQNMSPYLRSNLRYASISTFNKNSSREIRAQIIQHPLPRIQVLKRVRVQPKKMPKDKTMKILANKKTTRIMKAKCMRSKII